MRHTPDPSPRGVSAVIVDWNSTDQADRCVESMNANASALINKIFIVHNGSKSLAQPTMCTGGPAIVHVWNSSNKGFGAGCNQILGLTDSAYLLFLNPDIVVNTKSIAKPLKLLADPGHSDIGVIGIRLLSQTGDTHRSCARFPTPLRLLGHSLGLDRVLPRFVKPHFMTDWDHLDTRPVDQVMGAFMLMRRADFERIGGFDERFFLYMEDVDLCLRLRQAGQKALFVHDATAMHTGGGTTKGIKALRLLYGLRSRILYADKHFGRGGRCLARLATLLIEPAARFLASLLAGRPKDALACLRVARWLWRNHPYDTAATRGPLELSDV